MSWVRAVLRGEARRLPGCAQVTLILLALAGLQFTSLGLSVRGLPAAHVRDLVLFARRQATLDERTRARVGADYEAIQVIRERTPRDAVILVSDRHDSPSCLHPFGAKHQDWATYFLYPRKILYLHQRDNPLFGKARWLLVDTPGSISWIAPEMRGPIHYRPSEYALVGFNMAHYLEAIRAGHVSARYMPSRDPRGRLDEDRSDNGTDAQ